MSYQVQASNLTRGTLLGVPAVASTRRERRIGLLGTNGLEPGEGLVLEPCRSVHTFGMRYPIDVVFTDRRGRVVKLVARLGPGRVTAPAWRAARALELPAGTIEATGTRAGDELALAPLPA